MAQAVQYGSVRVFKLIEKEDVMKLTVQNTLFSLFGSTSVAFAAGGPETEGSGLLLILFIVFGALIILFQTAPGMVLFSSMMKGIFSVFAPKSAKTSNTDGKTP
jgi:hypothetical protein